jgi:autotransporter-associated beta strand protein
MGATTLTTADFNGAHNISNGIFVFGTGSSMSGGSSYTLSGNGNLRIDLAGFNINRPITGTAGSITKNNAGALTISASGGNFSGTYIQNVAGTTTLNAVDFAGGHTISAGDYIFGTGSSMGGTYTLRGTGNLKIDIAAFTNNRPIVGTSGKMTKTSVGALTIIASGASFGGTYTQTNGNTILTAASFTGLHNIEVGKFEVQGAGASISAGASFALGGDLRLTTDNDLTIDGAISGTVSGAIHKNGVGDFNIAGDGSGFLGTFTQGAGNTILSSNSFSGQHNISSGSFTFASGSYIMASSTFTLSTATALNITTDEYLSVNGNIKSLSENTAINKTGEGTLKLTGNNSFFKGTFTQSSGTTIIAGKDFNGDHNIKGGVFSIEDGAELQSAKYIIDEGAVFQVNTTSDSFELKGLLSGGGTIIKIGEGKLYLTGSNSFTGDFRQSGGETEVSESLKGRHYITGGTFIFRDGSEMKSSAEYEVTGSGILRIVNNHSDLDFNGQITGDGTVEKEGKKTLNLSEGSEIRFTGDFRVNGGTLFVQNQSSMTLSGIEINESGTYTSVDGKINDPLQVGINGARLNGNINLDADLGMFEADAIKSEGNIDINSSAKLNVNTFGIVKSTYTKIPILISEGNITGNFGGEPIEISGYTRTLGGINYVLQTSTDSKNLYLLRIGGSNYSTGELSGLTHNQIEIARSLDRISAGFLNGAQLSVGMEDLVFSRVAALASDEDKIRALDELAGSIIANALVMGATGRADEEIFNKVKWDGINKSAWGHINFYGANYAKDENAGQTNFGGYGFTGGSNLAFGNNWVAGVYAGIGFSNMEQDNSVADMSEFGAGLYGGYFGERVDVKARIYAGILNYAIDRNMDIIGLQANSEFGAYNLKFDVRAERVNEINELYGYALFGQVKSGYEGNSSVKESGAGAANLEIYAGSYFKMELLGGAELNFNNGKLIWRAKAFGGYLLSGSRPSFKGRFADSGEKIEIYGSERGSLGAGISWGAEYKITNQINAYLNLTFDAAERYSGYYGQVGASYRFGFESEDDEESGAEIAQDTKQKGHSDEVMAVLNESGADEIWDVNRAGEKVSLTGAASMKLKVKEGSHINMLTFEQKVYVFSKTSDAAANNFYNKLKAAGAEIEPSDLKKIDGVDLEK